MTATPERPVFFVSDSTGITAETLGNALLAQFPATRFSRRVLPFVDSVDHARRAVEEIASVADREPIVFLTVGDVNVAAEMSTLR